MIIGVTLYLLFMAIRGHSLSLSVYKLCNFIGLGIIGLCLKFQLLNVRLQSYPLGSLFSSRDFNQGTLADSENPSLSSNKSETSSQPILLPGPEGVTSEVENESRFTEVPQAENDPNTKNLKIHGELSVDTSRISEGWIILCVGGVPLLTINLHWILIHTSRSSRKSLSKWLGGKDFGQSPWPLSSTGQPVVGTPIISGEPSKNPVSSANGEPSVGNSKSQKEILVSKACYGFIVKLLSQLGLKSMTHSIAIFDSLRIWVTKNPSLSLRNPHADKKGFLSPAISLDSVIQESVNDLKSKRKNLKAAGTQKKSGSRGEKVSSSR